MRQWQKWQISHYKKRTTTAKKCVSFHSRLLPQENSIRKMWRLENYKLNQPRYKTYNENSPTQSKKQNKTTDRRTVWIQRKMGCRNAVYVLRMLIERAIEVKKDLYICFIYYEKRSTISNMRNYSKFLRNRPGRKRTTSIPRALLEPWNISIR